MAQIKVLIADTVYAAALAAILEEVRRNSYVYNYIIGQNDKGLPLYTQKQLLQYLIAKQSNVPAKDIASALSSSNNPATFTAPTSFKPVNLNFDSRSLEVKANWMPLQKGMCKDKYLTATYDPGTGTGKQTYVLVAMHIISKAISGWYWVSWEHKDNPLYGRQFNVNLPPYAGGPTGNATAQPKPVTPKPGLLHVACSFVATRGVAAGTALAESRSHFPLPLSRPFPTMLIFGFPRTIPSA